MRRAPVGSFVILVAENRRERMRGLRGQSGPDPNEGLLLDRCRSVHTFGMRFAIDVVLLDARARPIGVRTLAPGRLLLPRRGVRQIVEVAAGRGEVFRRALLNVHG
jgi:uncharacterized protein